MKHQRTEKKRRLNAMIDGATRTTELANYYDPGAAFLRLRRHGTFPLSLRALFAVLGEVWRRLAKRRQR
jgi:hypothetical protein